MISRRTLLSGLAGAAVAPVVAPAAARAQSWKAAYPELVYSLVPSENATSTVGRFGPFVEYLNRQLGTKVTLRIANDYAAVIEGQRAGQVHIANYGPAGFARALITGAKIEAFVIDMYGNGKKGYYSVFYVKADSPYKTINDLRGKNIAMVDPNSSSGYTVPLYTMDKLGIHDADKFFGKTVFAGSHENAIIALAQGTVDCCVNWWDADDDSNLLNMLKKGMVKNPDGTPATKEEFRIILTSDLIINSPTAMLSNLPPDLKAAIRAAWLDAPKNDPVAFAHISDGKDRPWEPVDNSAYDDTIKMIRFVDGMRKRAG
jgi:phosphonate transport system substrate-binding protein